MTQWTARYPLVIPAANKDDANNTFAVLDPDTGGDKTFSVPLNASGNPADATTHYGAYGPLPTEIRDMMFASTPQEFRDFVQKLAQQKGQVSVGDVVRYKNKIEIGNEGQDFFEFIASLGLRRVQSSEPI